ncbi:Prolyl 3-hydroxylase OGFOD1 [Zancudomyces culisetae]|uniref:Prolyl 3-hydroxylase OGFOD1 n=1 Tax=Zancudomyces culisetae TaxID=1213189 RepID=A0A1R1PP71_ZANCU|nr:Prolyl 3-hydroxylase OGFOD1 [Zancudomyces culisetae]|eukprot:OMH82767.1 Prolyl 3-hydroxylase OGFOD1 [Zancudomyces culisetae]
MKVKEMPNMESKLQNDEEGKTIKKAKIEILKRKESKPNHIEILECYKNKEFIEKFRNVFCDSNFSENQKEIRAGVIEFPEKDITVDAIGTVIGYPFHVGVLSNVFDPKFLRKLKKELKEIQWHRRLNDLYDFYQTDDLGYMISGKYEKIKQLYHGLCSEECITFMEQLTGTELQRGRIDLAAQQYEEGGFLLCHDDFVTGDKYSRKIAFILYLVDETWSERDGGALGLFSKDKDNCPVKVVRKISPKFNTLAFFLTGESSYHEVQEVLRNDGVARWSVTGWFYGINKKKTENDPMACDEFNKKYQTLSIPRPIEATVSSENDALYAAENFINERYLKKDVIEKVLDKFIENSCIELHSFLKDDVYADFISVMGGTEGVWSENYVLPPNLRRYNALLEPECYRKIAQKSKKTMETIAFLKSKHFSNYLSAITGLEYSKAIYEFRKFDTGSYTLLHDHYSEPNGLDVIFSFMPFNSKDDSSGLSVATSVWDDDSWGGLTHYTDSVDELKRFSPGANKLVLVYRDTGVKKFVRYTTNAANCPRYEFNSIFIEAEDQ